MPTTSPGARALFVNGTVGVGKTTVLDHLGDAFEAAQVPFALIDLDWLRRSWPAPEEDPFNLGLELANLAAYCRNLVSGGPRTVVLAGVLEDPAVRARYEHAVGSPLVVVRLSVDEAHLVARLRGRYPDPDRGAHLEWHLHRTLEMERALQRADLDDAVVEVADSTPREVAHLVLRAAGWT